MPIAKKPPTSLLVDEVYVNTAPSSVSNGILVFVLLVGLVCSSLTLYFVMGYSLNLTTQDTDSFGIKKALLELEYDKVGGKRNYDILQKYSQMQIKEQIGQIEKYINGDTTKASPETQ